MSLPDANTQAKASIEAAEIFVNHYYQALNKQSPLSNFYINSSSKYTIAADISINGSVVATPAAYSTLLEGQGPGVRYDMESFDVHVINPSTKYAAPKNIQIQDNTKSEKSGARMSLVVTTMGKVQFGKGREAARKMFTETFVLVPNWDSMAKNPPRGLKRWLIMSQNFRAL
ncbi:hypothetical protein E4U52_003281 [Claviceps spartinae]|nr:hypothetical protein E4U52_003281 [Claviceps spartinae]